MSLHVQELSFGARLKHRVRVVAESLKRNPTMLFGVAVLLLMAGLAFLAPWLVRKLVPLFFKQRFLHKKMPSGFKLPARARTLVPEADTATAEGVAKILAAIDRLQQESPTAAHPVFGVMTRDEWLLLHLRHSELHMSFAHAEGE